jgi:hypothetical protein
MQSILDRLVGQLQAKGMPKAKAYAVANAQLEKHGILRDGHLTAKGQVRQAMGAAGRAKDRASKASGRPVSDYVYDPKTNQATLRK